jgi:hypothetical protein
MSVRTIKVRTKIDQTYASYVRKVMAELLEGILAGDIDRNIVLKRPEGLSRKGS